MPWSARRARAWRALRSSTSSSAERRARPSTSTPRRRAGSTSSPSTVSSSALALEPDRGRSARSFTDPGCSPSALAVTPLAHHGPRDRPVRAPRRRRGGGRHLAGGGGDASGSSVGRVVGVRRCVRGGRGRHGRGPAGGGGRARRRGARRAAAGGGAQPRAARVGGQRRAGRPVGEEGRHRHPARPGARRDAHRAAAPRRAGQRARRRRAPSASARSTSRCAPTPRSPARCRSTTGALREALANPKARGQWGERMAEDVLRLAGFIEHVNYLKQTQVDGGTGSPGLHVRRCPRATCSTWTSSSRWPSYLRYLEAGTDAERQAHLKRFLRDVRLRVKELAKREYARRGRPAGGRLRAAVPAQRAAHRVHPRARPGAARRGDGASGS